MTLPVDVPIKRRVESLLKQAAVILAPWMVSLKGDLDGMCIRDRTDIYLWIRHLEQKIVDQVFGIEDPRLQYVGTDTQCVLWVLEHVGVVLVLHGHIFVFEQHTVDDEGKIKGAFKATGVRPRFAARIESYGIPVPADLFNFQMDI